MMTPRRRLQIRSTLNLGILSALAAEVAGPILIAELYRLTTIRRRYSPLASTDPSIRRDYFYRYLYRLASRGLIKIEGLRRRKRIVLTAKGRQALEHIREERIPPEKQSPGREGFRTASSRSRQEKPEDRFHALRRSLGRVLRPGSGAASFISYDVPERLGTQRRKVGRRLKAVGYVCMNASFYIGPLGALKEAIGALEEMDLLPYCCWGRMSLLPP